MPTAFLPFTQPCEKAATGDHGLDSDADAAQPAHAADPQCSCLVHRPAGPAAGGEAGLAAGDTDPDQAYECLR